MVNNKKSSAPSAAKPLSVVILAAGQGKRMKSALPKCLHPLAGKPLLRYVIDAAQRLTPDAIYVVIGHGGEQLRAAFEQEKITWVEQTKQRGTGHAVQQAMPHIPDDHQVLILNGDMPLLSPDTLRNLCAEIEAEQVRMLTAIVDDPTDYGRILRDTDGSVIAIVEEKDAIPAEKDICEVNTNAYLANAGQLSVWLKKVKNRNAQREYYLPDIIPFARQDGGEIVAMPIASELEVSNVNSRQDLAELEAAVQEIYTDHMMSGGVTLIDPLNVYVRGQVGFEKDVVIDVNVVLEGETFLGEGCRIEPHCVIRNSCIGAGAIVKANSVIENSIIEEGCEIGPFARLREMAIIKQGVKIGNFVEIKRSMVEEGSKINHLSYIGNAEIGRDVNIGAGVITCNYDGANKHKTTIGDRAFIGSNVQLIAPVTVGDDATIGAGSTITEDAPPNKLTLSRPKQVTVENWARPKKQKTSKRSKKERSKS